MAAYYPVARLAEALHTTANQFWLSIHKPALPAWGDLSALDRRFWHALAERALLLRPASPISPDARAWVWCPGHTEIAPIVRRWTTPRGVVRAHLRCVICQAEVGGSGGNERPSRHKAYLSAVEIADRLGAVRAENDQSE